MGKLAIGRGNLVRQVELLRSMGRRVTRSLPRALLEAAQVVELELEDAPLPASPAPAERAFVEEPTPVSAQAAEQ